MLSIVTRKAAELHCPAVTQPALCIRRGCVAYWRICAAGALAKQVPRPVRWTRTVDQSRSIQQCRFMFQFVQLAAKPSRKKIRALLRVASEVQARAELGFRQLGALILFRYQSPIVSRPG